MKERFALAASWGAFVWFVWKCGWVFLSIASYAGTLDHQDRDGLARHIYEFYSLVLERHLMEAAISPAVWLVLWIVTGSPRILPWRKPEQAGEE
ncbi:MAG: hypothetical protein CMG98_13785 [Marinovum sp.]|jgi:hypothetical protein|nr:hypothetical protein [Marinovum sp.]MAC37257.1 hypothetical protein [Halieaceae bacterium]MAI94268.1 hypothetical protein [Halieaceae bacterium]|tara:strand:+ start:3025 stop:3306 length:282 start_codon:yes stop_codon:yes gene_type:complete